ncbi:hypothetical protein HK102_009206, partial [Quaeritorhiza haematococci]
MHFSLPKFLRLAAAALAITTITKASPIPKSDPSTQASTAIVPGKWFNRIIIIVLENTDYKQALSVPVLKNMHKELGGVLLTNYHGIWHPSQPNYVGMIHGDIPQLYKDENTQATGKHSNALINQPGSSIVDLLEDRNISWKTYQEGYFPLKSTSSDPTTCNPAKSIGKYRRKHNPFVVMNNVREDARRCERIVRGEEFWRDVEGGSVPQYVFYTPDMDNSGHDTSASFAGKYLRNFLTKLLTSTSASFLSETLIVATYDESDQVADSNLIATWLFGGPAATSGGK